MGCWALGTCPWPRLAVDLGGNDFPHSYEGRRTHLRARGQGGRLEAAAKGHHRQGAGSRPTWAAHPQNTPIAGFVGRAERCSQLTAEASPARLNENGLCRSLPSGAFSVAACAWISPACQCLSLTCSIPSPSCICAADYQVELHIRPAPGSQDTHQNA